MFSFIPVISIAFAAAAWGCTVYDYKNEGYNYLEYKCYGHSVRCVKDNDELRIKNDEGRGSREEGQGSRVEGRSKK